MSHELELVALAALLWLYDSTVLLYADEVILSLGPGQRWQVALASRALIIAGRQVCFLNPFAFYRPAVRLRWNIDAAGTPQGADPSWVSELQKLTVASPWAVTAGLALFVLLPLGLFTPLGVAAILAAVVLLYGSILTALLLIRHRCRRLPALGRLKFAGLMFECIACPPLGVNIVRRAGLLGRIDEGLSAAAPRLLAAPQLQALAAHCIAVLDEELQQLEEDSPHRPALVQRRADFHGWLRAA